MQSNGAIKLDGDHNLFHGRLRHAGTFSGRGVGNGFPAGTLANAGAVYANPFSLAP